MTLVELLAASLVLTLIASALGALVVGAHQQHDYTEAQALALQHARVCIDRIDRAVRQSYGSPKFPCFFVYATTTDWRLPDTLIVWKPAGAPAEITGKPHFNEIVVFSPSDAAPNELLELTPPSDDTRVVPAVNEPTKWKTELAALKAGATTKKYVLTDLLRTFVQPTGPTVRGMLRFDNVLGPSDAEWTDYTAGTRAWNQLSWPQGIYGSQYGLRTNALRIELQMAPPLDTAASGADSLPTLTFFGASAGSYQAQK